MQASDADKIDMKRKNPLLLMSLVFYEVAVLLLWIQRFFPIQLTGSAGILMLSAVIPLYFPHQTAKLMKWAGNKNV